MIELVVKRPHPVLPSGISCIFLYSSFCSQKSLAYFLSLDSLELFESFYSFSYLNLFILSFLPFLSYVEKHKFDLSSALEKFKSLIVLSDYIDSSKKGLENYENFYVH